MQNLGYLNYYYELNALLFGLPQNRPRLLMISVYVGENEVRKKQVDDFFCGKDSKKIVEEYRRSKYYKQQTVSDLLRINYKNKKYRSYLTKCNTCDLLIVNPYYSTGNCMLSDKETIFKSYFPNVFLLNWTGMDISVTKLHTVQP